MTERNPSDFKVNILVVDDRPEKVLAFEMVLEDLGQNIVKAYSGKEALRLILEQEFAVILLDVNMPDMDGFETASLIRQRKKSESTPIIFITAFGDETHIATGYSLGAVDYILTPVVPEVLRTKVGVFIDLHRKSEELRRQTELLHDKAAQLRKLTPAFMAISSALSIDSILQIVADAARDVIGVHQAFALATLRGQISSAVSVSEDCSDLKHANSEFASLAPLVGRLDHPVRLKSSQLESLPEWSGRAHQAKRGALRGLLAAPLVKRDGRSMGHIQLSGKREGDFSEDDEAILVQLSQMTTIAIENLVFSEAREANRIKDDFLATLSHELRTPLTAILGWARLLRMEDLSPDDTARGLEVIERNVKAQMKLIEDLLDISRVTSGKLHLNLRPTNLANILNAAVDSVRPVGEAKEIAIGPVKVPQPDDIVADPDRLQQVIWNLLSNAIKFTPVKGRVELSVERQSSTFRIRVADNGAGISPEFLPFIFERFQQQDQRSTRSHGGLGIGLAVARSIVELHGGKIRAESAGENLGATFIVDIPMTPAQVQGGRATPAISAIPAGEERDHDACLAGMRILVVDDEKDARDLLSEILKMYRAEPLVASSVDEALDLMERQCPHVIVSDIAMPGKDGYCLIRTVRQRPPEAGGRIPAVALTAFASEKDRERALSAGFQRHVAKPVDPRVFVALLADLWDLRSRQAVGPSNGDGPEPHS